MKKPNQFLFIWYNFIYIIYFDLLCSILFLYDMYFISLFYIWYQFYFFYLWFTIIMDWFNHFIYFMFDFLFILFISFIGLSLFAFYLVDSWISFILLIPFTLFMYVCYSLRLFNLFIHVTCLCYFQHLT